MAITSGGSQRRKDMSPAKMVGWFDLGQLFTTAGDVLISTVLGRQADRRLLEPFGGGKLPVYDHSLAPGGKQRESITVDYISDTGDGWNSTYADGKLRIGFHGKLPDAIEDHVPILYA